MTGLPDLAAHAAEVAVAFGLGQVMGPMREVAGGEQARIWRLDTTAGSFAVKEPRRGFEPRTDGVDILFQEVVREQTDVLMPMPVRRPGGAFVLPLAGRLLRVATWMDLLPPDNGLDPAAVGRLLAALHQVDVALPANAGGARADPWFWAPVGPAVWLDLVTRLAAAGAPFAETLRAEVSHLLALERLLEKPRDLQMCHCDLWSDNLLRTTSGELCVIDWDNCGPTDPGHELAMLVFEFGQGDAVRQRALYDAYRSAGGPARLDRSEQLTMVIAEFGHFWQSAAEEWLAEDATDAERAHAEGRVAELMDPPLRTDSVIALVSACRD